MGNADNGQKSIDALRNEAVDGTKVQGGDMPTGSFETKDPFLKTAGPGPIPNPIPVINPLPEMANDGGASADIAGGNVAMGNADGGLLSSGDSVLS